MNARVMVGMVVAALALAVAYGTGTAQGPSWVGAPEYIGPAAVTNWRVEVDRAGRVLTVTGTVENRSDAALTNVRVGIGDEDVSEVAAVPATLQPGQSGAFRASLYTGSDWTVRLYVLADVVAPSVMYVPAVVRETP